MARIDRVRSPAMKGTIFAWMRANVVDHVDECGEVNCTALVESWDASQSTGKATLDPMHIAWDIAVTVAKEYEKVRL